MSLTTCRQCGTAVPAHAQVCPKCGASVASVDLAAYRPARPRPPEAPQRTLWLTIAGWVFIVAVGGLFAFFIYRGSVEADLRKAAEAEVAREIAHSQRVDAWLRDTSSTSPPPDSAGRPVPASPRAKRMWVVSRMMVDRALWERELRKRHGVRGDDVLKTWGTRRYWTNARDFPEAGRYLEGRVAMIAERKKTAAAWVEERTAALARESGLPAAEIRTVFTPGFAAEPEEEARLMDAMLAVYRHLVRVDPRLQSDGENGQLWDREEDLDRFEELLEKQNAAVRASRLVHETKRAREIAAFAVWEQFVNGTSELRSYR